MTLMRAADAKGRSSASLSGFLTDSQTGEALLGATVLLEGNDCGVASNSSGYYLIDNISLDSYTVKVSYVGH